MFFCAEFDDGEPLMELLQVLGGVRRGLLNRIAEAVRHRIEPLVDRVLKLRLPIAQHPDHRFEALRRGILRLHQAVHRIGFRLRRSTAAHHHNGRDGNSGNRHNDGNTGKDRKHLGHPATLCDSHGAERRANGHSWSSLPAQRHKAPESAD